MKYSEINTINEQQTLNEIAPLISIAGWFGQKYHDVIAASSKKTGQGEIQKFVNKHVSTRIENGEINKTRRVRRGCADIRSRSCDEGRDNYRPKPAIHGLGGLVAEVDRYRSVAAGKPSERLSDN